MKYIVTGGLGFIGNNIIRHLNASGIHDIIVVDKYTKAQHDNLLGIQINEFIDKDEFDASRYATTKSDYIIFHMGAQSSTAQVDFQTTNQDNIIATKHLINVTIGNPRVRLIYASSASVYGNGTEFQETAACHTESLYAWSKLTSDNYLLSKGETNIVGLRFFNVYGPHESHKGAQSSPIMKFFDSAINGQEIQVFGPANGFSRDFIHVNDVVSVCDFFTRLRRGRPSGIFNVGTGHATTFGALARYTSHAVSCLTGKPPVDVIEIESDIVHQRQYQKFTCADITRLRSIGYSKDFIDPGPGTHEYIKWLIENQK